MISLDITTVHDFRYDFDIQADFIIYDLQVARQRHAGLRHVIIDGMRVYLRIYLLVFRRGYGGGFFSGGPVGV